MTQPSSGANASMSYRRQFRLGFIGFGEIGQLFSKGLTDQGLKRIYAFDPAAIDGSSTSEIRRAAESSGIMLTGSLEELASQCDVLISATPGSVTLEAARGLAPFLEPRHLLVDLASCTPGIKRDAASVVAPSKAAFVDGCIVGPSSHGLARSIVLSGKPARQAAQLLAPWGMNFSVLEGDVGAASAVKILRSVVMKGLEALVVECLLAASRYGIDDQVIESLESTFRRPFREVADGLAAGDVIHAARRADEVDMSALALSEIGVDPIVTRAVADRLRWVGALDTKSHFGGRRPAGYREAVGAIEAALRRAEP